MNKKTIITKTLFSFAGILLLVFSINLFFNTTASFEDKKNVENPKNTVLSFSSSSFDYIKGAVNINPSIKINTENTLLINGINITYSVEGLNTTTVLPPSIIYINAKIIDPKECNTTINEANNNFLLTCYTKPSLIKPDDDIAFVNLDLINKLAKDKKIKIKIKDSNSYITINSSDQAVSLTTNEFVINIIDTPSQCLNIPNADINCDGQINSFDIYLFSKPASELEPYIRFRLDLNKDQLVNEKDKELFNVALSIISNR